MKYLRWYKIFNYIRNRKQFMYRMSSYNDSIHDSETTSWFIHTVNKDPLNA